MSMVRFTATKLAGTGKKGILKPDADGYYTLVIGGLNCLNSAGEKYLLEGARDLFQSSSIFQRRVKNGCLKAEMGHPKRLPGMTDDNYLTRILTIDEKNTCAHFKEVWLDELFGRNNPQYRNPELCAIMAKVRPAGPLGDSLARSLENPDENVCFSIRALTRDYFHRGVNQRVLQSIVNWDCVTEPGIAIATKYDTPSLEALEDTYVTRRLMEAAAGATHSSLATEDSRMIAQEAMRLFDIQSTSLTPGFANW